MNITFAVLSCLLCYECVSESHEIWLHKKENCRVYKWIISPYSVIVLYQHFKTWFCYINFFKTTKDWKLQKKYSFWLIEQFNFVPEVTQKLKKLLSCLWGHCTGWKNCAHFTYSITSHSSFPFNYSYANWNMRESLTFMRGMCKKIICEPLPLIQLPLRI